MFSNKFFGLFLAVLSLNLSVLQAELVNWSQDNVMLQENVGTGSLGLTLSAASSNTLTVSYTVVNETAIAGGLDIDLPSKGTVVIGAGNTTGAISFGVIADNVLEPLLETLKVSITGISGHANYTVGSSNSLTLSIQDDDNSGAIEVLWGWDSRTNFESDVVSIVPIYLSRPSLTTVSVNVVITGSVNIGDYGSVASTVTFSPGTTRAYYYPAYLNDAVAESTETMVLTLNSASGANVSSARSVFTYTILDDDDTPSLEIISGTGVITEGSSQLVYFRLSHPSSTSVTFTLGKTDGTASSGNDFIVSTGNIFIPAGSLETYVSVSALRDGQLEGNETFQLSISSPSNANLGATTTAEFTIVDKMPEIMASLYGSSVIYEHQGPAQLYLQIIDGVASKDNILVTLGSSGNASEGLDYTSTTTATIQAGSTFALVSIPLIDDLLVESDETLKVTITSAANANIRSLYSTTTLTILDNDTLPQASHYTYTSSLTEGAGSTLVVYPTLSRPYSGNVILELSYSGNATAGADYSLSSGNASLVFPANSTSTSSYVYLTPVDDSLNEGKEIFTATITSAANALVSSSNTVNITIIDNDDGNQEASLLLYSGSTQIAEAGSTVSYFRVYLSQPSAQTVNYVIGSMGGNATLGDDYTLSTNILSVPAGSNYSPSSITITAKSDNLNEFNETALVGITSASQGIISSSNLLTFSIKDSNTTPLVYFPNANISFYENSGYQYQYVYMDNVFSGNVTAIVTQTSGNAVLGTDYTLQTNTINFTSGQQYLGFYIIPVNTTLIDGTRDLVLTLSTSGNASTGSGNSLSVLILDNDKPNISVFNNSMAEGATTSSLYVSLDRVSDLPVYGNIEITAGTATLASDYSVRAQTFTVPAGTSSLLINFGVIDDDVAESSETMIGSLTQLVNASATATTFTATITDNDTAPIVNLSAYYYYGSGNTQSFVEGVSNYFYATLDKASSNDVYVEYVVTGGTATRTLDYGLSATGKVKISAGSTYSAIFIVPVDDLLDEPNETAIIQISKAIGAQTTVSGNTFTLTIIDNDEPSGPVLNFSTSGSHIDSAIGGANIGVSLNQTQSNTISYSVVVNAANTTAVLGTDYTFTAQTSTILAGNTTGSVSVVILNGSNALSSSYIQFELRAISGANVGNTATHILNIMRLNSVGVNALHSLVLPAYTGDVDYRMLGLPMVNLTASKLLDKLGAVMGARSDFTWQIYNYQASNGSYQIVTSSSNMQSGDGFWLASLQPVSQSFSLSAPDSTTSVNVNLETGWNMIANPFTTAISKENLSVSFGGNLVGFAAQSQTATASTLWTYTVSGGNATYTSANTLAAGQAAWLYAWSGNTVTLTVSPNSNVYNQYPSNAMAKSSLPEGSLLKAERQEPYPPSPPSSTSGSSVSAGGGGCLIKSTDSKETIR